MTSIPSVKSSVCLTRYDFNITIHLRFINFHPSNFHFNLFRHTLEQRHSLKVLQHRFYIFTDYILLIPSHCQSMFIFILLLLHMHLFIPCMRKIDANFIFFVPTKEQHQYKWQQLKLYKPNSNIFFAFTDQHVSCAK